jgi:DNA mismatch endonuclease, patch repair protein
MSLLREVGYPQPLNADVSRRFKANRRRNTRPERALRSVLHARGLRFRKDLPVRACGRLVRPDIVFPRARVAVFVDGCYWHVCPEHGTAPQRNSAYWARKLQLNVERDRAVDKALTAAGWRVIRIWEHERPEAAAKLVEAELAATNA